jgi:hypothetical protein
MSAVRFKKDVSAAKIRTAGWTMGMSKLHAVATKSCSDAAIDENHLNDDHAR